MKRLSTLAGLALAAALLIGVSGPARAGLDWNGTINGFGSGKINYTLWCADGQVIKRTTTTEPGSDACDDGSNSITWGWGALWHYDVREDDRKGTSAYAQATVDANLAGGGTQFVLNGTYQGIASRKAQLAVLKVPASSIPDGYGQSLDDLLASGAITNANIAFRRDYAGTFNDTYLNQVIALGGVYNQSNVIIFTYSQSENPVPGANPVVIVLLTALLAAAGGFVVLRQRRGQTAA